MTALKPALILTACVLFLVAGFGIPAGRANLTALGLAALAASFLL